jgi:hypothetical protein
MAETEMIEKHYCYPTEQNNNALLAALMSKGNSNPSAAETMALMNNGGFGGAWNNPLMYIMYMWLFRYMNGNGWGGYGDGAGPANFNNRDIAQLQNTVDNNHNSDLIISAIQGNGGAIHELASNLNCDFNALSEGICSIRSAIEGVGAAVGYSSEKVINAIANGDAGIINAVQQSACSTQKSILEMGYQSQLQGERQAGILGSKIDQFSAASQLSNCQQTNALSTAINASTNAIANGICETKQQLATGFSNVGFQLAQDTCQILQGQKEQTQQLSQLLQGHWALETSQQLQDAKNQISNLTQTQTILNAINGNCNCGLS